MFLNEKQKNLKSKALADLLGEVDSLDKGKLGKKPVVAEMSIAKVEPMEEAGHEGVEEKEEELFPAEEAKEEAMEEGGGISEEEKSMIEELYNRFCR